MPRRIASLPRLCSMSSVRLVNLENPQRIGRLEASYLPARVGSIGQVDDKGGLAS